MLWSELRKQRWRWRGIQWSLSQSPTSTGDGCGGPRAEGEEDGKLTGEVSRAAMDLSLIHI